jgi:hypothetical protein
VLDRPIELVIQGIVYYEQSCRWHRVMASSEVVVIAVSCTAEVRSQSMATPLDRGAHPWDAAAREANRAMAGGDA